MKPASPSPDCNALSILNDSDIIYWIPDWYFYYCTDYYTCCGRMEFGLKKREITAFNDEDSWLNS